MVLPQVAGGKAHAIAVTSPTRSSYLKDVPTVAESGYPKYQQLQWYGIFGPAGMPAAVVEQLNAAIVKALKSPDLAKQLTDRGLDPAPSTPAELGKILADDIAVYAKVLKAAGIEPQ